MSLLQRALNDRDRGFSLIEVIVAISVFAILSLGIAPLVVSSIRGSDLSRSFTVGKNLASEGMERVRGLPFFDTAANRDVLDLYFPNLVASGTDGYNSTTKTFRTTCTATSSSPASSATRACPPEHADGTVAIPPGYTVTFEVQFVAPVAGSNPETYAVQTPTVTYNSSDSTFATPPTSLTRITIRASWNRMGGPRSFQLVSMLGDRKLSPDRVRATASIDFMVHALTSYKQLSGTDIGRLSSLTAVAGRSTSDIEMRSFAIAQADNSAGTLELARDAVEGDPNSEGILDSVFGASAGFRAPPPAAISRVDAASGTIDHPDLIPAGIDVGFLGATSVNESNPTPVSTVVNGLPAAAGNFAFPGGNLTTAFWVTNQANRADPLLQLHLTKEMFAIFHTAQNRLAGSTYAEATAVLPAASRKVEATATGAIGKMVVLPTSYMTGDQGVVVIDDLEFSIDCKSTGTLATSVATGSWSATLRYWRDSDGNGLPTGGYVTEIIGTPRGVVDPLADIKTDNPVVFDAPGTVNDVHLFADGPTKGYLEDWSTTPVMTSVLDAQSARVSMAHAINIITAQTDLTNEETKLTIDIGKMSCQAVDKRGL